VLFARRVRGTLSELRKRRQPLTRLSRYTRNPASPRKRGEAKDHPVNSREKPNKARILTRQPYIPSRLAKTYFGQDLFKTY
jgi:hypothetical protein